MSDFFLFFGSIFIALFGFGQLVSRHTPEVRILFSSLLFICAVWHFQLALFLTKQYQAFPHLLLTHLPFLFASAPLLYALFYKIYNPAYHPQFMIRMAAFAFCITVLLLVPVYTLSETEKLVYLSGALTGEKLPILWIWGLMVMSAGYIWYILIIIFLIRKIGRIRSMLRLFLDTFSKNTGMEDNPTEGTATKAASKISSSALNRWLGAILIIFLSAAINIFAGHLLSVAEWKIAGAHLITIGFISMYLMAARYPRFIALMQKNARKGRYEKSRMRGLDVAYLEKSMNELMRSERLYAHEDFTIKELARALEISVHQVSELLNHQMQQNFHQFTNSYRIEEIKRRLIEDADTSILAIAFDAGFNSKSVFYNAFQKYTGTSPAEYRKLFSKPLK